MERVEIKRIGSEVHVMIDGKDAAQIRISSRPVHINGIPTEEKSPYLEIRGGSTFTDAPRDSRAEAYAWRDEMLAALRSICGPDRQLYYPYSYGGDDRTRVNAQVLREAVEAFGGHFGTFFEVLCSWIAMYPVGSAVASPEPTPEPTPPDPSPSVEESRPEYVKCIKSPFEDECGKQTLCGRPTTGFDFLMGLNHVYCHTVSQGRLLACSACIDAAITVLKASREGPRTEVQPQALPVTVVLRGDTDVDVMVGGVRKFSIWGGRGTIVRECDEDGAILGPVERP